MKTLTQIIRLISETYVEEIDMNDILEGAIIGMLDRLDPHSSYISEVSSSMKFSEFGNTILKNLETFSDGNLLCTNNKFFYLIILLN